MWRISYRMFHAVAAISEWAGRRTTPAGLLVLSSAVLAGALGIDTTLSVAYQAFGFLAALVVVAALCLPVLRARVAVERALPRVVTAGESFSYRVRVRNGTAAAIDGLSVVENVNEPKPTLEAFRAGARFPTYRGWKRLIYASRTVQVPERPVPALAPGAAAEV